jgi:hypothetical protein
MVSAMIYVTTADKDIRPFMLTQLAITFVCQWHFIIHTINEMKDILKIRVFHVKQNSAVHEPLM